MPRKPKKEHNPVGTLAEAPARILPTHSQDRFVARGDREAAGWRNVTWPIQIAYEAKPSRLSSETDTKHRDANSRWLAMLDYYEIYEAAYGRPNNRDSTNLDHVDGARGDGFSLNASEALKKLVCIDSFMSEKDRIILRALCEGGSLPGSVRKACGDAFVHTVAARIRDALDAADDAIVRARAMDFNYFLLDVVKSRG